MRREVTIRYRAMRLLTFASLGIAGCFTSLFVASFAAPWLYAVVAALLFFGLRSQRQALVTALVVAQLLIVYGVLVRGGYDNEAALFGRSALGLVSGLATVLVLARVERAWVRPSVGAFALCGWIALHLAPATSAFPAYRVPLEDLAARAPIEETLGQPDAMRAIGSLVTAGFRDARVVQALAAYADNADLDAVRELCAPAGRAAVLPVTWRGLVEKGERLCRLSRAWPESAIAELADADEPMLARLCGDLALEAGDVELARAAYERAGVAGDRFARVDSMFGLLARGRLADAVTSVDPENPFAQLAFGHAATPATWSAWNDLLDFTSYASASRRGIRSIGAPGDTTSMFEPSLGRRVLVTRSRYGYGFALRLPSPPGNETPKSLFLHGKTIRGLRLELFAEDGTSLVYACNASGSERGLPEALCKGVWTEVTLPIVPYLGQRIDKIVLRGDAQLARLAAVP